MKHKRFKGQISGRGYNQLGRMLGLRSDDLRRFLYYLTKYEPVIKSWVGACPRCPYATSGKSQLEALHRLYEHDQKVHRIDTKDLKELAKEFSDEEGSWLTS